MFMRRTLTIIPIPQKPTRFNYYLNYYKDIIHSHKLTDIIFILTEATKTKKAQFKEIFGIKSNIRWSDDIDWFDEESNIGVINIVSGRSLAAIVLDLFKEDYELFICINNETLVPPSMFGIVDYGFWRNEVGSINIPTLYTPFKHLRKYDTNSINFTTNIVINDKMREIKEFISLVKPKYVDYDGFCVSIYRKDFINASIVKPGIYENLTNLFEHVSPKYFPHYVDFVRTLSSRLEYI